MQAVTYVKQRRETPRLTNRRPAFGITGCPFSRLKMFESDSKDSGFSAIHRIIINQKLTTIRFRPLMIPFDAGNSLDASTGFGHSRDVASHSGKTVFR